MKIVERLKKLAATAESGLGINQLRVVVALERAVARLEAEGTLREHLIFKGGFVLLKTLKSSRFTRDIDALAYGIDQTRVAGLARKALEIDLKDGLWFVDTTSEALVDQGEYGGLRLSCAFQISELPPETTKVKKLSRIHVDIGFGDTVPESAKKRRAEMQSLFGEKPVSWKVYPLEYIFAEKLQTLLVRGSANSRAKDVYDMVEIFPKCKGNPRLKHAIRNVFQNRGTDIPENFVAVVKGFDLRILSGAWGSVDVGTNVQEFEKYWKQLIKVLQAIDRHGE